MSDQTQLPPLLEETSEQERLYELTEAEMENVVGYEHESWTRVIFADGTVRLISSTKERHMHTKKVAEKLKFYVRRNSMRDEQNVKPD
jgi:hypothetical protein